MTRGKVEVKRIENPVNRRITFSKRKVGLLKKAEELAILCDSELALLIFSPSGNLYKFGSPSIKSVMEKYKKYNGSIEHQTKSPETIEMLQLEVENLRGKMINLNTRHKRMIGDDLDSLSFKEIKYLEQKVKLGRRKLRSRKDKLLQEYIGSLQSKGTSLEAENALLGKKLTISVFTQQKTLKAENALLGKKICRNQKSGDTITEIKKKDTQKGRRNSATQQGLLQSNLHLTIS